MKPLKRLVQLFTFMMLPFMGSGQIGHSVDWNGNFEERKAFYENIGQYDDFSNKGVGTIKYVAELGPLRVFFGEKGLHYYFLEAEKVPKEKREELKKALDAMSFNHKQKEKILGKFKFKMDEINMEWGNESNPNDIIALNETVDYRSYAKKKTNGKVKNFNYVRGFESIVYKNLYPNIDVRYDIHPVSGIKYTVILHPGANPNDLTMVYDLPVDLTNAGVKIPTIFGDMTDHSPYTFYRDNNQTIQSSFIQMSSTNIKFQLDGYDDTRTVIIDPWIQSPTFTTSSAVWEVETDGAGNVYVIGGETPMQLKKYNSAGVLQWTYTTPWDTASVWLGTLATEVGGTSYITAGVSNEIERITTAGAMVYHTNGPGFNDEYWSITFNCDNSKLIVGGTYAPGLFPSAFYAAIYDINITNGSENSVVTFDTTGLFSMGPVEVRSISSSKNAKYIFLTHDDVGAINQNLGVCPSDLPVFQHSNQANLGYKCENYLPATQNGGGLKALVANDQFFYTHAGNTIRKWDLYSGALIASAAIPGGSANNGFGGMVVHCSGLSVDACGNIYAGSMDRVVKFDQNLNVLGQGLTTFNVYDVDVNSNGEVLAVGAQSNNQQATRNGRIQSLTLSACAQYALTCCDANVCPAGPFCVTDPPTALSPNTPGGTWSGPGINATTGVFDPAVAGIGLHTITYTLPCGTETLYITVTPCNAPIVACEETNSSLSASGGNGTYSWYVATLTPSSTPINNEAECIACPTTTPSYFFGIYTGCSGSTCATTDTTWTLYGTGTNTPAPSSYPIKIVDGNGDSLIVNNQAELGPCPVVPLPVGFSGLEISCNDSETELVWVTISEVNNEKFIIERAPLNGQFREIAAITVESSQNGNTYRFTSKDILVGPHYYRLIQVDNDGKETELATKAVNCSSEHPTAYPNPFDDIIHIDFAEFFKSSSGQFELLNTLGQPVLKRFVQQGEERTSIRVSSLSNGIYILNVKNYHEEYNIKLVKK